MKTPVFVPPETPPGTETESHQQDVKRLATLQFTGKRGYSYLAEALVDHYYQFTKDAQDPTFEYRYRLWDLQEQTILEASDDMMDVFATLYEMENTMQGTPYKPGDCLHVLRKNEVTGTFDVLFVVVRGSAQ